jgi:alanyl-tRNA synthetase
LFVSTFVDYEYRAKIEGIHPLMHGLNHALREVIGSGTDLIGVIVDAATLRFDCAHGKALTLDEEDAVEKLYQQAIEDGCVVSTCDMQLDQAKELFGLQAVPGEIHPDPVLV